MSDIYSPLKLENQLCFPLYACAKEVVRLYRPYLEELNLTYTQYIAMMVFWEYKCVSVKELGQKLFLDSGTLTPMLKNLETKGYVRRFRSNNDERVLLVELTPLGEELKDRALHIPKEMTKCVKWTDEESLQLYRLLYKALNSISSDKEI